MSVSLSEGTPFHHTSLTLKSIAPSPSWTLPTLPCCVASLDGPSLMAGMRPSLRRADIPCPPATLRRLAWPAARALDVFLSRALAARRRISPRHAIAATRCISRLLSDAVVTSGPTRTVRPTPHGRWICKPYIDRNRQRIVKSQKYLN